MTQGHEGDAEGSRRHEATSEESHTDKGFVTLAQILERGVTPVQAAIALTSIPFLGRDRFGRMMAVSPHDDRPEATSLRESVLHALDEDDYPGPLGSSTEDLLGEVPGIYLGDSDWVQEYLDDLLPKLRQEDLSRAGWPKDKLPDFENLEADWNAKAMNTDIAKSTKAEAPAPQGKHLELIKALVVLC